MRPLTLDDLLSLEEYAGRRREFFEAQRRYLDRYRRIRIGPRLALVFENRQTLWFRIQEIIRIARLTEPELVQQQLDLYNVLLPVRDQLQAALLAELSEDGTAAVEFTFWKELPEEAVRLRLADRSYSARFLTCRPEDRAIGAAHWVCFSIDESGRRLLKNLRAAAYCEVAHDSYQHLSQPLSEDLRQSLAEDLELSDRD
jgi:hypothetical protein